MNRLKPENHPTETEANQNDIVEDSMVPSEVERGIALEKARESLQKRSSDSFKAYLVSLETTEDEPEAIQESLQELGSLVRTLGDQTVGATVQKRSKPVPATHIGAGKAQELQLPLDTLAVDYVAFDQELSPSQVRNLEKIFHKPVLDRPGIILQIFRNNAKTKEAKTQVEIAHLEYLAPRLSNAWVAFERQRSGAGGSGRLRGAGETQLELDKRRIQEKIAFLKKELIKIQKERKTQRKDREEAFQVVLVGYTNAGKTSLMNGLTESALSSRDALFETLDSTVRILRGSQNLRILITDTVGFIRNLPHGLVASFQSTLEEVAQADLILHVVDVSHRQYKDQIKVTDEVLKEVKAAEVPRIMVFNKLDQLQGEPRLPRILSRTYPGSICVSSQSAEDIKKLKQHIIHFFEKDMVETTIQVSHTDNVLLGKIYAHAKVLSAQWTPEGGELKIRISTEQYARLFPDPKSTSETSSESNQTSSQSWDPFDFQSEKENT